jgi:hypothetical protein
MARCRKITELKREGVSDLVVAVRTRVPHCMVRDIWAEHKDSDVNSIRLHLRRHIAEAIESEFSLKKMTVIDLCHLVEQTPGWRLRLLGREFIGVGTIKEIESVCRKEGIRVGGWIEEGGWAGLTTKTYRILKELGGKKLAHVQEVIRMMRINPPKLNEEFSRHPEFEKEMRVFYDLYYRR